MQSDSGAKQPLLTPGRIVVVLVAIAAMAMFIWLSPRATTAQGINQGTAQGAVQDTTASTTQDTTQGAVESTAQPVYAVITQNDELIEMIDLSAVTEPREITLPGNYHETVRVEPGRIRFLEADCPDLICVRTGWLQEPGEIAVCIPNKAIITICE